MNTTRSDQFFNLLSARRLSRRAAMRQGGAGLAAAGLAAAGLSAAAAQDATPAPSGEEGEDGPAFLFVQSFQSGAIVPVEGQDGRYTVTLDHGLGQTLYFSDRPDRIVGASPTDQFLAGLGFVEDNPPNAALVVETGAGETDLAVVELYDPVYDDANHTLTYQVQTLANWEDSVDMGFGEAPIDLAQIVPSFGAAHLFIDDCADANPLTCYIECGTTAGDLGVRGMCWDWNAFRCLPCQGGFGGTATECNQKYSSCRNQCFTDQTLCGI